MRNEWSLGLKRAMRLNRSELRLSWAYRSPHNGILDWPPKTRVVPRRLPIGAHASRPHPRLTLP